MSYLDEYLASHGADMAREHVEGVLDNWRAVVQAKLGSEVELAAPFQRHYSKLGTGLPPNFCLALTADEAVFFKFDPRHGAHPLQVTYKQIRRQVGAYPRPALRVAGTETGRLAVGVLFELQDGARTRTLPCRTPRLRVNPAAAAMIVALGGALPAS